MTMKSNYINNDYSPNLSSAKVYSKTRLLIFILEIVIILALLVIWLTSESLQKSKSLIVLFFYSFPSEFLIGLVPHEPVLIYFGRFHKPITVALVAVVGTVLAEAINYSVFRFVADMNLLKKMIGKKTITKTIEMFKRFQFVAIWVAGFTPVPFFPFRFLVVMSHYPMLKYLIAVFLSRAPRFYILAQIGNIFKIPGYVLIALFIILIFTANIALIRNLLKMNKELKKIPNETANMI